MEFPILSQAVNGVYLDPSNIRCAGNPMQESIAAVDSSFEIADLPVKLELRYLIETKRAANGLECPAVDYNNRSKKVELTAEEEEKRKLRRERNKVAASKCRMKRKMQVKSLTKSLEELEAANRQLESEIAYLTAEREQLEMMLDSHIPHCTLDKGSIRGPA